MTRCARRTLFAAVGAVSHVDVFDMRQQADARAARQRRSLDRRTASAAVLANIWFADVSHRAIEIGDRVRQLAPARSVGTERRPGALSAPFAAGATADASGGGAKAEQGAQTLGLHTVGDLFEHLPRDHRDARGVAELTAGETATVVVEVLSISSRPVRRRGMRPLVEATVADGTATMKATFFNQPWLVSRYPAGTRLMLHGKYESRSRFRVQGHAITGEAGGGGGDQAVGHYPATEGLSSTQILALVRDTRGGDRRRLGAAARHGCGPSNGCRIAVVRWRRSTSAQTTGTRPPGAGWRSRSCCWCSWRCCDDGGCAAAPRVAAALEQPPSLSARWLDELLPFAPTADQRRAFAEIDGDLQRTTPMQRLLMGEVGSGKTVVALYALLRAVEHGLQGALMAPTEPLAEQHFATIQALMAGEAIPIGLLTGSTPARRRSDLLGKLQSGELSLIVGTHALIEEPVRFRSLAVAVIDEQHRFGVRQRAALDAKAGPGRGPHMLHMTATPIPRTLALSHYGDLDFTVLDRAAAGSPADPDTRLLHRARA